MKLELAKGKFWSTLYKLRFTLYKLSLNLSNRCKCFQLCLSINVINWSCAAIDYSENYWARKHLQLTYYYYLLKIADLLDTVSCHYCTNYWLRQNKTIFNYNLTFQVFFILRKKTTHVSFLHTYHHAMMVVSTWIGVRFLGGGHSYFLGFANSFVHIILYSYYLVTAYNSKYGQLIWLKKLITQAQLVRLCDWFGQWMI